MLRITCPNCHTRLHAKDKLVGRKRKCPKCGKVVLIEATQAHGAGESAVAPVDEIGEVDLLDEGATPHVEPPQETEGLAQVVPVAPAPREIKAPNRYLICDRQRIVAVWEANGAGWQLASPTGLIAAKRNTQQIPSQGVFRLVELHVERSDEGLHLAGIACHELAPRWALPAIGRGDDPIVEKIVGPAGISRDQKQMIRRYLQEAFMPEVWRHRQEIVDFLANDDFHTQGVI